MKSKRFKKLSSVLTTLLLLVGIMLPNNIVLAKEGNSTISIAPTNPEFIKYQSGMENGILNTNELPKVFCVEEGKLGYIPSPVENPFKIDKQKEALSKAVTSTSLPPKFDLRTVSNKLSPVRDQNPYGSCWTFATYGSLESNLRPSDVNDFSEDNLMNNHGGDWGPNQGGNEYLSMAYLGRWSGPIKESEDPYNTMGTPSNLKEQKHIQNVDFIAGNNVGELYANTKEVIKSKGAVYTTMFWNPYFYDEANKSYFCDYESQNISNNHAVTIVGWDDTFSKDKFNTPWGTKPENNGAFIIRNSWGATFGDKGYFYISYDDLYSCIENVSFNNAESVDNYKSIYQYDSLGYCTGLGLGSTTGYAANVFTATSNDILTATSFYTNGPNTAYEIKIYDTVEGSVFSGLKATKSGTIANMGYHTVKLDKDVQLTENKKFAVSIKFTTPNNNYPIALEMPFSGYSSNAKANPGESYASSNGSNWSDIVADFGYANSNVCIKAFTKARKLNSLTIDQKSASIVEGSSAKITVNAAYADAPKTLVDVTDLAIAKSANDLIATPANGPIKGQIDAVKVGKTTITYSFGGKTVAVNVTVLPKLESIAVSTTKVALEAGKGFTVKAAACYSDKSIKDITSAAKWDISDSTVATVKTGKITAAKTASIGSSATVTVSYNNFKANIDVKIVKNVKALITNYKSLTLPAGSAKDIVLTATYADLTQEAVKDKCAIVSSKPAIATVIDGKIEALSPGTTSMTFNYGSKSAVVSVTVKPEIKEISIVPNPLSVEVGKTAKFKAIATYVGIAKTEDVTKYVEWSSSDVVSHYITMNQGAIKGNSVTDMPILVTATFGDEITGTLIYVIPTVKTFSGELPATNEVLPKSRTMYFGESLDVRLMASYMDPKFSLETVNHKVTMVSSNENIASVNINGIVAGKTAGTAKITYTYGSKTITFTITVKPH